MMPPGDTKCESADGGVDLVHSMVARALERATALQEKLAGDGGRSADGDGAAHAGDGRILSSLAQMVQDSQAELDRMSERARFLEGRLEEATKYEDMVEDALEDLAARLENLEQTLFEAGGYSWDEMCELMENLQCLTAEASAAASGVENKDDGESEGEGGRGRGRGRGGGQVLDVAAAISSAKEAETENIILRKLLQDAGAQLRALTFPQGLPEGISSSKITHPADFSSVGSASAIAVRDASPTCSPHYPGLPSPAQGKGITFDEGRSVMGSSSIDPGVLNALHFAQPPQVAASRSEGEYSAAADLITGAGGASVAHFRRGNKPKSQFGSPSPYTVDERIGDAFAGGTREDPTSSSMRWHRPANAAPRWREELSRLRKAVDGAVCNMKEWDSADGEISRLQASVSNGKSSENTVSRGPFVEVWCS
jgi:nucleotide-binding universal stress UspA family protein